MKAYKGKSLAGAQRRVRELMRQIEEWKKIVERFDAERKVLAMLAAEGPCFSNPLIVAQAKQTRNEILSRMNMNPDGMFKKSTVPA